MLPRLRFAQLPRKLALAPSVGQQLAPRSLRLASTGHFHSQLFQRKFDSLASSPAPLRATFSSSSNNNRSPSSANQEAPKPESEQDEEQPQQATPARRRMKAKYLPYHLMGYGFFLGLAVFTAYLGKWQLERREWKQKLLAAREKQLNAPPMEITSASQITPEILHRPVRLLGRFEDPQEAKEGCHTFFVGPRYAPNYAREKHQGQIGGSLLTAFVFNDGSRILVDRGWVRSDDQDIQEHPDETFVGVVQLGEKKPSFMTYESETVTPGQPMLFVDLQAMHRLADIPTQPHMKVEAEQVQAALEQQQELLAAQQQLVLAERQELSQILHELPPADREAVQNSLHEILPASSPGEKQADQLHLTSLQLLEKGMPPIPNFSSKMLLVHLASPQPSDYRIVRKPLEEYRRFYTMPDTHAAYAGTWFSLSAACVVIMLMRFRRGGIRFF